MAKMEKLVDQAREHLEPGENILASVFGAYEAKILGHDSARNGVFIATDRRLAFYAKKMFGYDLEVFPYRNVSSIEMSKGLMGHSITFFASGNKSTLKWINQGNVSKFVALVKEHMSKQDVTSGSRVASQNGGDVISQVERLAKLKEQGILTDEEFTAAKKELFGSGQVGATPSQSNSLVSDIGSTAGPDGSVSERVLKHVRDGSKIQAIAAYREESGVGLKEAKDFVERLELVYGPKRR